MYFALFGGWFWVLIGTEAASAIGLAEKFAFTRGVPNWVWWTVILLGLAFGPIIAFHRLRLRLETALEAEHGRTDDSERQLARLLATREYKWSLVALQAEVRALELDSSVAPMTFDGWKKRFYELLQGAANLLSNSHDPAQASVLLNVPPDSAPVEKGYNEEHVRMVRKLRAVRFKLSNMLDA